MIKLNDLKWKYRVKRHKFYKTMIGFIIRIIAIILIRKGRYKLKISYNENGYDPYVYCKHAEKQWCRSKMYWRAGISKKDTSYMVQGNSKEQLYLELINLIIFRSIRFPFC